MTKRMLIDAAHAEETRVVVLDGQRIEELDFESQSRKQLRGNIYLAKVTRVEPSLQAAFVEYGGNRHGFLSFTEIHPDYYQIPVADREALLREDAEADDEPATRHADDLGGGEGELDSDADDDDDDDVVEEELERRRRRLMRRYKIQEVVRRRQIMLIQVVKEERGNKGAALTTYLSLAGRYCVLMPNTARGGGISRKITNGADRKRLKAAAQELEVPQGMGVIVRTAGAARTKMEIKRDYEYLLRMWENIRETTLQSIAPALIYAEEDLVKRAIRDMYDKDLDGILVQGEAGYREARDFMRMIMPSQAKKIQHYRDPTPLFVAHRIEDQLAQINSPVVPLRSGGYIVINQTEALVAIDVNSGRATRERNIEATALKTNLEAAEEATRQLRLRDLAGLIVIDFIDMDEAKNNRAVEKVLKDCLKDDRARVQMGKISGFGLMEISRQRRRSGVLEGTTHICEHCQGTGRVRSVESSALGALRAIEVEAAAGGAGAITVRLPTAVGLYVLNEKRVYLARLEHARDLTITIAIDEALSSADVEVERTESREASERPAQPLLLAPAFAPDDADDDDFFYEEDEEEAEAVDEAEPAEIGATAPEVDDRPEEDAGRRRRGRRRGRRGEDRDGDHAGDRGGASETEGRSVALADGPDDEEAVEGAEPVEGAEAFESEADAERRGRRRRRGRRGGRRLREELADGSGVQSTDPANSADPADPYVWVDAHGGRAADEASRDVYAWRDPHEPRAAARPNARSTGRPDARTDDTRANDSSDDSSGAARAEPAAPGTRDRWARTRSDARTPAPASTAEQDTYAWSDAAPERSGDEPEREARAPRGRRPRHRRGRGGADRSLGERGVDGQGVDAQNPDAQSLDAQSLDAQVADGRAIDGQGHGADRDLDEPQAYRAEGLVEPDTVEATPGRLDLGRLDPNSLNVDSLDMDPGTSAPILTAPAEAVSADPMPGAITPAMSQAPLTGIDIDPIDSQPATATPMAELVVAAPEPAEPDPAEISAPPTTVRRGWWRRG